MPSQGPSPESWVAFAVSALNQAGSWTGRVHLHKSLVVAQLLDLAEPPFGFTLYQYGPYSFALDGVLAQMEMYGYVVRTFPQEGYGPKYLVTDLGREEAKKLGVREQAVLTRVANAFGKKDSQSLELLATCLWVERREGVDSDDRVVARVAKLKPKYAPGQIEASLRDAHQLVQSLSSTDSRTGSSH